MPTLPRERLVLFSVRIDSPSEMLCSHLNVMIVGDLDRVPGPFRR